MIAESRLAAVADRMLDAQARAATVPLPSQTEPGFDVGAAFAVATRMRDRRLAAGRVPRGWKIGFTNRSIWPRYKVYAPIWANVWDHTLTLLDAPHAVGSLAGLCQPRLEPEIVFGLKAVPEPGMDNAALARCIEWVAHGFEVVHTHFEGWRFTLADCMVDDALHGRLYVGPRVPAARFADLAAETRALRVELLRDGEVIDRGDASIVLDGPVDALRQWIDAMAASPAPWPVHAGDLVTTGTITDAWPLAPGQRWRTRLSDPGSATPRLADLTIEIPA